MNSSENYIIDYVPLKTYVSPVLWPTEHSGHYTPYGHLLCRRWFSTTDERRSSGIHAANIYQLAGVVEMTRVVEP